MQRTTGAPGWRENRQARIARQQRERIAAKKARGRPSPRGRDREEEEEEERPTKKGKAARGAAPRIGFLRASAVERAFILMIYGGVLLLVALSIIGTFYGSRGMPAPISDPGAIWDTMWGSGTAGLLAVGIQIALSLTQYGARQMGKYDARWWLLYLAALGISLYFNYQAYYAPLLIYMLPGYALALIVAFDILPEFVSIRHD